MEVTESEVTGRDAESSGVAKASGTVGCESPPVLREALRADNRLRLRRCDNCLMVQRTSSAAAGGTGLLAVFVDLDVEDRAGFRPFLAEDMFPPRREIGFGPAASFDSVDGGGQQFLTLYVAPSFGDLYGAPYQGLRSQRGERDAAYHDKFRNQDRYVAAWTGPEVSSPDPSRFASHLYVDRFDLSIDEVQAFNIWFACDYLPGIAEIPGVISVRRYLAVEGLPVNIVLHELTDPSVVQDDGWLVLREELRDATSGLYVRELSGTVT